MRIRTYIDLADEFDICDSDITEVEIPIPDITKILEIANALRKDDENFAHAQSNPVDISATFISSEGEESTPEYFPYIKVYRNYCMIVWSLDNDDKVKLITANILLNT